MSDYLDDYEREPHADLFFKVMGWEQTEDLFRRGGAEAEIEQAKAFYRITDQDIAWYREQEFPPSYMAGASWEDLRLAWDKIKVSYEAYQASLKEHGPA